VPTDDVTTLEADADADESSAIASSSESAPRPDTAPRGFRARRKAKKAGRSRARRITTRVVALAVVVALIPVGWSYMHALTAQGTDPLSVRSVEWIRDHGGARIVNWVEHWWYTHHPPPVGGRPKHGLPHEKAPTDSAASKLNKKTVAKTPVVTAPPVPPHLSPPPNIAPIANPPVANEGVWQPTGRTVQGLPAVYSAFMRPDPVHTSLVTGVAWMDTKLLRAVFVPGLQEPGGGPNPWHSEIPDDQRAALVAAFNSGFKMAGSRGGYYTDGQMVKPLRDGAASLVIYTDGTASVGMWGRDFQMGPNIKTVRQNLDLMVDGGQPVPGLNSDSNSKWGATLGNKVFVWRSAVGVDANGGLIYVAGSGLNAQTLGDVLVRAGAVRAMELDINSTWVSYYLYDQVYPGAPNGVRGRKLLPDMQRGDDRYLRPGERDFFALFAR
jgi:hypothetical protein